MKTLEDVRQRAAKFTNDRDWQQFQSPKNLSMALSVEVSELLEHFQWLTQTESKNLNEETLAAVKDEIADVQLYLVRLADELNIDIIQAVADKADKNELKYPLEKVKGSAKKYTAY